MGTQYWDVMFNRATADTALTNLNQGETTTQGTYSPQYDGVLLLVRLSLTPQAASSLAQVGYVHLICSTFTPNTQRFVVNGFGLATAPQAIGGSELIMDYPLGQPVKASTAITGQDQFLNSPVTPQLTVVGLFST
jgi:hypothetical protein